MTQTRHLIDEQTKVGEARRQVSALALEHRFDPTAAGRVAIAATELATNLLKHGGGGELLVQPIAQNDTYLIELISIDRGKGMRDVDRCLSDGYSTAGSSGTGLGAVRRLAVEFDVYSLADHGTVVMARIGPVTHGGASVEQDGKRFGAVNVAMTGETVCGDRWRLAKSNGLMSLIVADGLGHGILAADAALQCTGAFESSPFDEPRQVMERAHRAAQGGRGAAAACVRVMDDGTISYSGVGNIGACAVSAEKSQGMVSHGGTLGLGSPKLHQFTYTRELRSLVIMHSDGISARWDLPSRPGLLNRHPAVIAAVLYRDCGRGNRDDSTVVVME